MTCFPHHVSRCLIAAAALLSVSEAQADDDLTPYEHNRQVDLLAVHIGDAIDDGPSPYAGYVVGGLTAIGAGTMLGLTLGWDGIAPSQQAGAAVVAGGLGLTSAGAFASYAFPDAYQTTALRTAIDLGAGTSHIGLAMMVSDHNAKVFAIAAAARFSRGLLHVTSAGVSEPASPAQLEEDRALLVDRGQRLSPQSIQRIEADFERSVPGLSPWLLHSPLMIGGMANLVLMAEDNLDTRDMALRGLYGGVMLAEGLAFAIFESFHPYDDYQDELADEGLRVAVGPGPGAGLAINGRF